MSLPTESQLQQALSEQRATFESDMTRQMLESAKEKCFTRCFGGVDGTPNQFASATPLASSTSSAQTTCLRNCVDKFLEARTLIYKKTIRA